MSTGKTFQSYQKFPRIREARTGKTKNRAVRRTQHGVGIQRRTHIMTRANKVTVIIEEDGSLVARFMRTHKHIGNVSSHDGFVTPEGITSKNTIRELFRLWAIQNADQFEIEWSPDKQVVSTYAMPNKYTSDELLLESACKIVRPEIDEWVANINKGLLEDYGFGGQLILDTIQGNFIDEVSEYNGRTVSPKYGNGNWAYANVGIEYCFITESGVGNAVITVDCKLVSGQLKKPSTIGDKSYNMSNLKIEIMEQMQEAFPKIEKVKETKTSPKQEESKEPELPIETPNVEVEDIIEPKPKKKAKSKKEKVQA